MKAFVLCMMVAGAVAVPYGGWEGSSVSLSHSAPVAYAQPIVKQVVQPQYVHAAPVTYAQPIVKQVVQPQYVHAAPVAYAQPIVKQVVQPQYVHAAPVVKAIAPASSYSTFSQTHVSHPQIVKVAQPVAYAQPVVKVAQPVAYAQPVSHGWSQPLSHGW